MTFYITYYYSQGDHTVPHCGVEHKYHLSAEISHEIEMRKDVLKIDSGENPTIILPLNEDWSRF